MIAYIQHLQINKLKWDECISNSFNELIYPYSWYLDIVSPNWDCIVLDDYAAVMPLTWRKKAGILYLYPPLFAQQLGVFSKSIISASVVQLFLENIPAKFKYIDINLNSCNCLFLDEFKPNNNQNFELSLSNSYETLFQKYKGNAKRNVKKSRKCTLRIKNEPSHSEIIELFKKDRGLLLPKIKNKDYHTLYLLFNELEKRKSIEKFGVYNTENELIAGAFFVFNKNKATFIFSGNSSNGKKSRAIYFLIDYFIQKYSNTAITIDFEGGNTPQMASFYSGFGAHNVYYLSIKQNKLPMLLKWIKD